MPTGSVIVDPQELRQFAGQLKHFNDLVVVERSRLEAGFRRLGDTWRDPAYDRFTQEFAQTMKNLRRFQQEAERVVPELLKKADRADEVHR